VDRVFILDEIVVQPGRTAACRQAYAQDYVPAAERRGMRLEGAWQSPPGDYEELPATLYYLWSVDGPAAWWRMRLSRDAHGADERFAKLAWWQAAEALTLSRKRSVLAPQPKEP